MRVWRLALGGLVCAVPVLFAADKAVTGKSVAGNGAWEQLGYARRQEGNFTVGVRWEPERGIRLLVAERRSERQALIDLAPDLLSGVVLTPSASPTPITFMCPEPAIALDEVIPEVELVLKFRDTEWCLYLDQHLVGRCAAPFVPPVVVYCPAERQELFTGRARFQPVSEESFRSDFMIEEGAPNQLYPWEPVTGDWRIHTALDDALQRPESNVDRIKKVPLTADKSPNFYCLKGKGEGAMIVTGYPFYDEYRLAAAIHVNNGEAGLLFYYRDERNYYGYALRVDPTAPERGTVTLWRVSQGVRTNLARIRTNLFSQQWYRPEVVTSADEITCLLDGIELVRLSENLPVGGKIGLVVSAAEDVRLDDVSLSSNHAMPLSDLGLIRHHMYLSEGTFFDDGKLLGGTAPDDASVLTPRSSREPQRLILGRPHHLNTAFSATFDLTRSPSVVGLICGYRAENRPYYRFELARDQGGETMRLLRLRRGREQLVESWDCPFQDEDEARASVRLKVDATTPGVLRCYRDDVLVLVSHPGDGQAVDLPGAAGVYLGPEAQAEVHSLSYQTVLPPRFAEQRQKNAVYEKDSFMRHWSSPEGQWIAGNASSLRLQELLPDAFRCRFPVRDGGALHLGCSPKGLDGLVRLAFEDGKLHIRMPTDEQGTVSTREYALADLGGAEGMDGFLEVGYEEPWFWVRHGEDCPVLCELPIPLAGGARAVGYSAEQVSAARVESLPRPVSPSSGALKDGWARIDLSTVDRVRYHTLHMEGEFYREATIFDAGTPGDETDLVVPAAGHEQLLIFGDESDRESAFAAVFSSSQNEMAFGIVLGFADQGMPYYRCVLARDETGDRRITLIRINSEERTVIGETVLPSTFPGTELVKLGMDASASGWLRVRLNGRPVLLCPVSVPPRGGGGVWLGKRTECTVRKMTYAFRVPGSSDSAVADGAPKASGSTAVWAAETTEFMWHKGDFFGDFSISFPCVDGLSLYLGADEAALDGDITLAIRGDRLSLSLGSGPTGPSVTECKLTAPEEGKAVSDARFTVHREDALLWVTVNGTVAMKQRLSRELSGPRVRLAGLTLAQLAESEVRRMNVIDDFFNEAPHRWLVNGGDWQIINRFQCTPSWSHMIGESASGMAALWHKSIFEGDLTLEFYAGSRHGYSYARPGDLNCTIMASEAAPDSGYTVTCTEWDYNLSENWSSFMRKGVTIDRSDKYLVPRPRKGNVRKFLNPLVSKGRPIHGAWYYIKLRRIGSRLQYYFDNELVFEYDDPEPLTSGVLGIWTFMHSMTVAQVKMTFEKVQPRSFPFEVLAPAEEVSPASVEEGVVPQDSAPGPSVSSLLFAHGGPVDCLAPEFWSCEDSVGYSRLEPFRTNSAGFRVRNRLGAGALFAAASLPPLPIDRLAGWRLYVKRTDRAPLNVHYSTGTVDAKGTYTISRHFFHRISGTGFTDGSYMLTGQTDVKPCEDIEALRGDWQRVTLWLPSKYRPSFGKGRAQHVRLEGIGNKQPNYIMCGVGGAFAGDGYAVRQLSPIFVSTPDFRFPEPAPSDVRFLVRKDKDRPELFATADLSELTKWLSEFAHDGVNTAWLQGRDGQGRGFGHELIWLKLPECVDAVLGWHPTLPDTVLLRSGLHYVDPRFASATLSLAGTSLALESTNDEQRLARLPRSAPHLRGDAPLVFSVDPGTGAAEQALTWQNNVNNGPPVLTGIEGLTPFCETFERDGGGTRLVVTTDGRMAIAHDDPLQGRSVHVRNRALNQRLTASLKSSFSAAEFPLLQFRYRAHDMTHLSIAFSNSHYVRLGDDYASAVETRLSHDLIMDETWRSWLGIVSDAFTRQPFSVSRFTHSSLKFASCGSRDQTGRYSQWQFDDVVFGPAVSSAEQLVFEPCYWDADGVDSVHVAVSRGEACYVDLSEEARQSLCWTRHDPGSKVTPALTGLPDGVHHVLLRATDTTGRESPVTDLPFLLDMTPLTVSHSFGAMSDPASNGVQLTVTMQNGGGAPWAIDKATFSVAGGKQAIPAWTSLFVHSSTADVLHLNYPFIFRKQLDAAKNADTLEFAIDGIRDGAGNQTAKLSVPIKVDYSKDKVGPAWYVLSPAKNVFAHWNWDGCRNTSVVFSSGRYNKTSIVHRAGQTPFLQSQTYYTTGELYRAVNWKPANHPWLSCRIRLPGYRAKTTLQLALVTSSKKTYTISLKAPGKGARELNRSETITWDAKTWKRLSFNVRDMLKQVGVTDAQLKKLTVTTLYFQRRRAKHAEVLWLDDFFLHAAKAMPKQLDVLKWYAYDASGVASLELSCYGENNAVLWKESTASASLDLAPLRGKASGRSWLMCQAKDKAGNLSVPFWFPFPKD